MHVVSRALLRAPLLPASALADPLRALEAHPLATLALRIASPSLHAHADEHAARAHRRYAQRAAFRATPHALWAGVAVATIEDGPSRVSIDGDRAIFAPSWERLAALGRALLDTEAGWRAARFRQAPSVLRDDHAVVWLAYGTDTSARRHELPLDPVIEVALSATARWVGAGALMKKLRVLLADPRALILQLVDDGLLHHDLEPPLVGVPPLDWAREKLGPLCPPLRDLRTDTTLDDLVAHLADAPGHAGTTVHATLVCSTKEAQIERAIVERAAALAPYLTRLADALHPPVAESQLVPGLDDALAAAGAVVGEGLLDAGALELGRYGARVEGRCAHDASLPIVAWLAGLVADAARTNAEIVLDQNELDARLPASLAPSSFELQLTPSRDEAWLLGLHAPAGASWGRFASVLGAPLHEALVELHDHEPGLALDVSYAPTRALADLCTTPALRDAALALSSWPAEGALLPAQCAIANDPVSDAHRGVVAGDRALAISPLHRVRSSTAPPSVYRALLADRLRRQHAPWAFDWGPLRGLSWLPRVRLDGFVIAPQSWRLPSALDDAALFAWRAAVRAPRWIQVGVEDALLPVDLDSAEDRTALSTLPAVERARAWEIWPPLGHEIEAGGRRVELVCAVLDADADTARAARLEALAPCPPPAASRKKGWRTVKLFASRDRHAELLVDLVAPFVEQREVKGWFFLPYTESPGERHHLRVRVRGKDDAAAVALADELAARARRRPHVAAVEVGDYVPEVARYGDALPLVERVFESDAHLAIELAAEHATLPIEALAVAAFDALAAGLGFTAAARLERATIALAAHAPSTDLEHNHLAPAYRSVQRDLLALLDDPWPPFTAHKARVARIKLGRAGASLFSTLAHLTAVRLCGPDRDAEIRALYLWKRALESRRAMAKQK